MDDKDARIAELEAELERERMRLVACGVVAMANTRDSAREARQMLPEYRSASLCDVERAVDREMAERERLEAKKLEVDAALDCYKAALNAMRKDWREMFESTQAAGVELADERKRREDAEAALSAVIACHNSDPILIAREPGYRWHDVIKQAIAHFARYKD